MVVSDPRADDSAPEADDKAPEADPRAPEAAVLRVVTMALPSEVIVLTRPPAPPAPLDEPLGVPEPEAAPPPRVVVAMGVVTAWSPEVKVLKMVET